jgi:hypothetical protein
MPTLDYSPSRPRLSRRSINAIIAAVILVALIIVGWKTPGWYRQWQAARLANAYRVIDAEIPGTEVYIHDKLLGKTPLILSKADCAAVGLPTSPATRVGFDGWAEGLPFEDPTTNSYPRLMYKVPSSHASLFMTCETPWGLRTKLNGAMGLSNGSSTYFMPRGANGVIVSINFNSQPDPSQKVLKLNMSVINQGNSAYSSSQPSLQMLWGTFDVQWDHRSGKKFPLPADWKSLAPGQTLQTTVEIPLPDAPGDYSVFAILNFFQNEGNGPVGLGSVYSDSKLLRMPQPLTRPTTSK